MGVTLGINTFQIRAMDGFFPLLVRSALKGYSWVLESEMREGFIGLRHAVHFLALLHRAAPPFRGLDEFRREALSHRLLAALARRLAQPAHRERRAPHRPDFDRHLEVG